MSFSAAYFRWPRSTEGNWLTWGYRSATPSQRQGRLCPACLCRGFLWPSKRVCSCSGRVSSLQEKVWTKDGRSGAYISRFLLPRWDNSELHHQHCSPKAYTPLVVLLLITHFLFPLSFLSLFPMPLFLPYTFLAVESLSQCLFLRNSELRSDPWKLSFL